jgi:hypothetical protein
VSHFRVRIHERLLVDAAHAFQIANVEGVLRAQITRVSRFDFTAGFVIVRLFLQHNDLSIGKHNAFSGDLFLKRLQPLTEALQVMSLPDRAHAATVDKHAFFTQLITGPVLTVGRELNGVLNNRRFSGFIGPTLQVGHPTILINQRVNAAFFSQLLEAVERVA